jgi:hypothetical protein
VWLTGKAEPLIKAVIGWREEWVCPEAIGSKCSKRGNATKTVLSTSSV